MNNGGKQSNTLATKKVRRDLYGSILSRESLLLALFSLLSFLIALSYEAGRLSFYGVPLRLVQINTITITTTFLVLSIPFLIFVAPITVQGLYELQSTKSLTVRTLLKVFYISVPVVFVISIFKELDFIGILGLGIIVYLVLTLVIVLWIFLSISKFTKESFWFYTDSLITLKGKGALAQLFVYMSIVLLILSFAFIFGHRLASNEKSFLINYDSPNEFVVAIYDNRVILKSWDTNREYFNNCLRVIDLSNNNIRLRKETLKNSLKDFTEFVENCD